MQCAAIYVNLVHFVVLFYRHCSKGPRTYPQNSTSNRTVTVEVIYPTKLSGVKDDDEDGMVFALAEKEGVVLTPDFTYEHLKEVPIRNLF